MNKLFGRLLLFQLLVAGGCNFTRLIELTQHISQQDDIRSLVVFSKNRFTDGLTGFDKFLKIQGSLAPVVLITDEGTRARPLGQLLGYSIVFVFIDSIDNANMLQIVNVTLRMIHLTKMTFVIEHAPKNNESFIRFFKACFRMGIINIIIMLHNQVLSYDPFPTINLTNLTLAQINEYFPDKLYNLKGYKFFTPIQQDGPRVFISTDKHGNQKIGGVNTEIFHSFVQRHNASLNRLVNVSAYDSFEITKVMRLIENGQVDILIHSYSYVNPERYAWSYPIGQVKWIAMVPSVDEIAPYMYLIMPFDIKVWVCLAVSFIYISLAGYITLRYCHKLNEYGPMFSRCLTQFLYLPSTTIPCNLRGLLFDIQIIFYALILTNIYSAFLSAFLTTTVHGKQIDTFAELVASGIKVMTTKFESGLIKTTDVYLPIYGDRIFHIVENDVGNEFRKSLNRTYAFLMAEDRIFFFLGQQKYLEKKRMHVSKSTLGYHFLTFTMQLDSPFKTNLDKIVVQLYQTGLYTKWEKDVFDLAVASKYLNLFRTENEHGFRPLTRLYLFICWMTYVVGIVVSFGVFLLETVRFKIARKIGGISLKKL